MRAFSGKAKNNWRLPLQISHFILSHFLTLFLLMLWSTTFEASCMCMSVHMYCLKLWPKANIFFLCDFIQPFLLVIKVDKVFFLYAFKIAWAVVTTVVVTFLSILAQSKQANFFFQIFSSTFFSSFFDIGQFNFIAQLLDWFFKTNFVIRIT